jgi:hypothetical protein
VKPDESRDQPVLDYSGTPAKRDPGHSAEGFGALVAGCVNALALMLLFARKFPPQTGMMVAMSVFFVSLWGLGFAIFAVRKSPHESFALIGLTTNTLALLVTIFMGVGACCFGYTIPIAPLR